MALSGFESARIGIYTDNTETIDKDNIFTIEPKTKGGFSTTFWAFRL